MMKVICRQSLNTHLPFCIGKLTFMSSLSLKSMLTNSGIATAYIDLFILLFILTLKAAQLHADV